MQSQIGPRVERNFRKQWLNDILWLKYDSKSVFELELFLQFSSKLLSLNLIYAQFLLHIFFTVNSSHHVHRFG